MTYDGMLLGALNMHGVPVAGGTGLVYSSTIIVVGIGMWVASAYVPGIYDIINIIKIQGWCEEEESKGE